MRLMQRMIALVVLPLMLGSVAAAAKAPSRPNVVVILVDDLRWDEIGCAGHPFVQTPNIDRLAREGGMFNNAFATTPLCSPVRACLLTGQYTHHHKIYDNTDRSARSHRLVTFPKILHDAGYETGYVGKWHMGNDDSQRPGFDDWVCIKGQGETRDPPINDNGTTRKVPGYITDIFNARAVRFIERKRDKPFCLYLAHKAIHPNLTQYDDGSISDPSAAVIIPAERHQKLYTSAKIVRRPNARDTLVGKPALQRKIGDLPPLGPKTQTSEKTIRDRLRMLAAVDDGVGAIYQSLVKTNQLDNTVFVFMSDHGYFNGEHGLSVERRLPYEEAARIPLLIRYPALVKSGSRFDRFALSIDLAPTLLDISGVEHKQPMDGRSLVPLLTGKVKDWRQSFLIEYYSDTVFPRVLNMGYKAVRNERYKYIRYNRLKGMNELYDLKADPYEMKNIIGDPKSAKTLASMRAELSELLVPSQ